MQSSNNTKKRNIEVRFIGCVVMHMVQPQYVLKTFLADLKLMDFLINLSLRAL